MKTTSYRCDRCGADLGEGACTVIDHNMFRTRTVYYEFAFWRKNPKTQEDFVVYELCQKCRDSLERWLNQYE